jgi:hypothetical protein
MIIPQNTASTIVFKLVSTLNGYTPVAGNSGFDCFISINGGAFSEPTNAPTEIGNGWYAVELTATETANKGQIVLFAENTGVRGDAVASVI